MALDETTAEKIKTIHEAALRFEALRWERESFEQEVSADVR